MMSDHPFYNGDADVKAVIAKRTGDWERSLSTYGRLKVVRTVGILNDTNVDDGHFGCIRVMNCIRDNLGSRELEVAVAVPSGVDWRSKETYKDALSNVDLILINGEGTLHHGRRKGRWLLEVATSEHLDGIPKAVVNAVWQDNPGDWAELLAKFDLVATRDSRSASLAKSATGRDVRWMPDFSLYAKVERKNLARNGIVIGDSASGATSSELGKLGSDLQSAGHDVTLVPVVTSDHGQQNKTGWKALRLKLRLWRIAAAQKNLSKTNFVANVDEYLACLQSASVNINGRFHSICLSLATYTPFIAFSSNSWKIEALIEDVGLDQERLVSRGAFGSKEFAARDWSFSQQELANIDAFLAKARSDISALFDDVSSMAGK